MLNSSSFIILKVLKHLNMWGNMSVCPLVHEKQLTRCRRGLNSSSYITLQVINIKTRGENISVCHLLRCNVMQHNMVLL